MDRIQVLKKSSFFSSLPDATQNEVSRLFIEEKYEREDYIFFEWDAPEWFYIVREGKIKLVKHSDSGKDVILQIFAPGDMFGEFALFERKPYPTSAQAMEPSTILKLSRKEAIQPIRDTSNQKQNSGGFRMVVNQQYHETRDKKHPQYRQLVGVGQNHVWSPFDNE